MTTCALTTADLDALISTYAGSTSIEVPLSGVNITDMSCELMNAMSDVELLNSAPVYEIRVLMVVTLQLEDFSNHSYNATIVFRDLKMDTETSFHTGSFQKLFEMMYTAKGHDAAVTITSTAVVTEMSIILTWPRKPLGPVESEPLHLRISLLMENMTTVMLSDSEKQALAAAVAVGMDLSASNIDVMDASNTFKHRRYLNILHNLIVELEISVPYEEQPVQYRDNIRALEMYYFWNLHTFVNTGNATALYRHQLDLLGEGPSQGAIEAIISSMSTLSPPTAAPSQYISVAAASQDQVTSAVLSVRSFTVLVSLLAVVLGLLLILASYRVSIRMVEKRERQADEQLQDDPYYNGYPEPLDVYNSEAAAEFNAGTADHHGRHQAVPEVAWELFTLFPTDYKLPELPRAFKRIKRAPQEVARVIERRWESFFDMNRPDLPTPRQSLDGTNKTFGRFGSFFSDQADTTDFILDDTLMDMGICISRSSSETISTRDGRPSIALSDDGTDDTATLRRQRQKAKLAQIEEKVHFSQGIDPHSTVHAGGGGQPTDSTVTTRNGKHLNKLQFKSSFSIGSLGSPETPGDGALEFPEFPTYSTDIPDFDEIKRDINK